MTDKDLEITRLQKALKEKERAISVLCEWIGSKSGMGISEYTDLMVESGIMSIGEGVNYLLNHGFTDREVLEILHLDD